MNRQKPFSSSSDLSARKNAQMIYANKLIREDAFKDGRNTNLYSLPTNRDYSNYITTTVGGLQTDYDISNEDKLIVIGNENSSRLPGAPTNVTGVAGNGQCVVSWTESSSIEYPVTSYVVTSSPGAFTATTTGTTAIVSGLTNGTAYTFTVVAINDIGQSPASAASAAVTPVGLALAPTGVTVTKIASGQIQVSFTQLSGISAATGGTAITGYTITPSPAPATSPLSYSFLGSTYTFINLTPSTSYTFAVFATNFQGNSAATTSSAITA